MNFSLCINKVQSSKFSNIRVRFQKKRARLGNPMQWMVVVRIRYEEDSKSFFVTNRD